MRILPAAVLAAIVAAVLPVTASADPPRWAPPKTLSWYWQLSGALNTSRADQVQAIDVDAFDTGASTVAQHKSRPYGRAICYFSAGTFENWRPDAGSFPASVKGSGVQGWPGENWLDVRQLDTLRPIMQARIDLCKSKGFDAVEGDNVDGYSNSTGFPISASDQLAYNRMLASQAHAAGMAIFLKNDVDQVGQLQPDFDGALNEQCGQYGECGAYSAFLGANKPVLRAEYSGSGCGTTDGAMLAYYGEALTGDTQFSPCWAAGTLTADGMTGGSAPPAPSATAPSPAPTAGAHPKAPKPKRHASKHKSHGKRHGSRKRTTSRRHHRSKGKRLAKRSHRSKRLAKRSHRRGRHVRRR